MRSVVKNTFLAVSFALTPPNPPTKHVTALLYQYSPGRVPTVKLCGRDDQLSVRLRPRRRSAVVAQADRPVEGRPPEELLLLLMLLLLLLLVLLLLNALVAMSRNRIEGGDGGRRRGRGGHGMLRSETGDVRLRVQPRRERCRAGGRRGVWRRRRPAVSLPEHRGGTYVSR